MLSYNRMLSAHGLQMSVGRGSFQVWDVVGCCCPDFDYCMKFPMASFGYYCSSHSNLGGKKKSLKNIILIW